MSKQDHLRQLLEAYSPVDAAERRYRQAMLDLLALGSRAFERDHFQPGHFTASAFVLDAKASALLLIHHTKLNRWLQPGGHVESEDADLIASARRELREETGIETAELAHGGIFDIDIHDLPALHDTPTHQHFDVRFLFRTVTLELAAASDASDARWWPLATISTVHSDASVMRPVERMLQLSR